MATKLDKTSANIAANMDDEDRVALATKVIRGYERDRDSRSAWASRRAEIRKLFSCMREPKSFPWPGASKAAVPIITVAVSQFQARAVEELLPSKGVANVVGTGAEDQSRALRVEKYMNTQIRAIRKYADGMDKTLAQVALDGTAFRKTWYDEKDKAVKVAACPAADVVVSYTFTGDIRDARRITHLIRMTPDELAEMMELGIFREPETKLGAGKPYGECGDPIMEMTRRIEGVTPASDEDDGPEGDFPRLLLECHCLLRLPGDKLAEPYVVTVDYDSKEVLRVVSREYDEAGETKTQHYFVKFGFFPNSDGFYDYGLGSLLESYNACANSIVNMLIDSGTLANTTTGLVSERSGLKKGDLMFRPGELKPVGGMMQEVAQSIHLFKFPEPSNILFQLLGSLQRWGKEIASVNDIMQGLEQASNQTATTTITLVEQGLKLFAAVHKRMRAAYQEELEAIYLLDRMHLSDEVYNESLGDDGSEEYQQWVGLQQKYMQDLASYLQYLSMGVQMDPPQPPPELPFSVATDFSPGHSIIPVADPQVVSQAQRLIVAKEAYMTVAQNPFTAQDPAIQAEGLKRYFEAMGLTDVQKLIPQPPPPAPPPQDLDQVLENAMFIAGDFGAQVLPQQVHEDHLQKILDLERDPLIFADMLPERKQALAQHKAQHEAFYYLTTRGFNPDGTPAGGPGQPLAVPTPQSAATPGPTYGGGHPGMGERPGNATLPPTTGPGEAFDNAPGSLRGRFPGLREASGLA